ncbi:MAG TPA: hypothetical protein VJP85_12920 [Candidatus Baltobacteraceae bacterium]|nr:hypothetical protein [Candidatus Baltobacteraceae bacterium]
MASIKVKWEKLGRIFDPAGKAGWMVTHAALPTPMHVGGDRYRIYCAGRDAQGRSQVGFFEIDLREPREVRAFSERPVLRLGDLGAFDDCGVMNTCLVRDGAKLFLYYVGMSTAVTVPFRSFTGLAESTDGGHSFERVSRGPILPPDDIDPFLTAASFVRHTAAGWQMWYTSGTRWATGPPPQHYYHIKYAESDEGKTWRKAGRVAVDFVNDDYAIARPWVLCDDDRWRMWYSHRGDAYRLGYAESGDGLAWRRMDHAVGIQTSAAGWDSEMICYASVFDHGGERFMLYNGNRYGLTGIGLARLAR